MIWSDAFELKTDMAFYDNMRDKPKYHRTEKGLDYFILLMPPERYLTYVEEGFKAPLGSTLITTSPELAMQYSRRMKRKNKFPMLTLEYTIDRFTQEGRHRALAARLAGVDVVPVMVVFEEEDRKEKLLQFIDLEIIEDPLPEEFLNNNYTPIIDGIKKRKDMVKERVLGRIT